MGNFQKQKILVLDASMPMVQVGVLEEGRWLAFFESTDSALQTIFQGTEQCLKELNISFKDLNALAFAHGPGSLLGIRLTAMALRTWKSLPEIKHIPAYAYNSLKLAVSLVKSEERPFYVLSAARKGFWYLIDSEHIELKEVKTSGVPDGLVYYLPQNKIWEEPPHAVENLEYNLKKVPEALPLLFEATDEPDALILRKMEFAKWIPSRHKS